MTSKPADILYYDGQCPLCTREMAHLGRLKGPSLDLVDIHTLPEASELPARETLLAVLHLRRGDQWLTGVDASVAAWQHTRYGMLWRWMRWPMIGGIIDVFYRRWALWRYRRLYGARCEPGQSCN